MSRFFQVFEDARKIGVRPHTVVILIGLQLLASACELVGLVSFVPIFQFINSGGNLDALVAQGGVWPYAVSAAGRVGVTIGLPALLLFTLFVLILRQGFSFASEYYDFRSRETAIAEIRSNLFGAFLRASTEAQDKASSGGMVNDMSVNSLRAAQHVFSRFALATQLTILGVYAAGMTAFNPRLMLFLALVIGASGLVAAPYILRSRRLGSQLVKANKNSADFVIERLRLARLVRLSRMEPVEAGAIRSLSHAQKKVSVTIWRTLGIVDILLETLAISSALLFIYVGTVYFGVPIEVVGVMIAMLTRLVPVVRQLARTKQFSDAARAGYDSVINRFEQLSKASEVYGVGEPLAGFRSGIEFKQVSFAYKGRQGMPALSNVSFTIPRGTTTAIVGPSGSGKSTLVDLLPRLRDPDKGVVAIDGRDNRDIELGSLRSAITLISQSPVLFDVPLIEHIRYGAAGASIEDVKHAAWLSGASDFIELLPNSYETRAGEGGKMLSGGQRQRLDLARVLLTKAPILILDEPTTGLDVESVRHLLTALSRIREETDTTIIIISHDLDFVADADQIVVMNGGRVEALGRHQELIGTPGWYLNAVREPAAAAAAIY